MNSKEIIKEAIRVRGYTQKMLAESAGLAGQTNVASILRGKGMTVDNFVLLLNSMGFDVVVKDRNSKNTDNTWKVERNVDK